MGGACCRLNDPEVFKEKLVDVEKKDEEVYKIIRIQSLIRAAFFRFKFRIKNMNKGISILTRKASIVILENQSEIPGKLIDFNTIKVDDTVNTIERKLGEFIVEEKELIHHIQYYKPKLKHMSFMHEDGTIYYGYYNKNYEREGYGILILPDGSKYIGFFKNNKMNGRGRLISSEGDYYEGNTS
jgi:hypothetical protein